MKPYFYSFLALLLVTGCTKVAPTADDKAPSEGAANDVSRALLKDIKTDVVIPGTGPKAADGDLLAVQYRGTLKDSKEPFDENMSKDKNPFGLVLGAHMVIKGWDQGLVGTQKGETLNLGIPAALAYGPNAQAKIPANSDLYFDIKVLDIVKKEDLKAVSELTITKGSGPVCKVGDIVSLHYTLKLANGKVIDDIPASDPVSFTLGARQASIGFDVALQNQTVGSHLTFRLPPDLLIGGPGTKLPPNQPAYFDVIIDKVEPGKK